MSIIDRFKNFWYGAPNSPQKIKDIPLDSFPMFLPKSKRLFHPKEFGLSEITYFTCMRVLTETIAKIHLDIIDDSNEPVDDRKYWKCLNLMVNPAQSRYDFLQHMVFCILHYGNYYAYPRFNDKGYLEEITPLNPVNVTMYVDNKNILNGKKTCYQYIDNDNGISLVFLPEEIIHIKGFSKNGYLGLSILEILKETIESAANGQAVVNDQYKSGMIPTCALQYTGDLNTSKRKELLKAITNLMDNSRDSVSRIIPIPLGMELKALNIKLTDSEYTELRKYTASQIAAAFGVPLSYLNQSSSGTAGDPTKQSQQLYSTTLQPLMSKIEIGLTTTLLSRTMLNNRNEIKFRVGDILSVDAETQANIIKTYLQTGVYSINDARRILGLPDIDGGDSHIINNGASIILENGKWTTYNTSNVSSDSSTSEAEETPESTKEGENK